MRINDYSSIKLATPNLIPNQQSFNQKFIEKILLFLIAFLGFMGSLYVFTSSSNNNNNPNYQNLAIAAASVSDYSTLDAKATKFKDFFKIDGKKKAGEMLNFIFKEDRNESRFVLDMGNGERVIITSNEFPYKFDSPGKYKLELKTINRGLITVVATKELKIK
jgi:hypothetical protein